MEIRTNRDLYLAVCGLKKVHGQKNVDLQNYLERVLISSCVFRTREKLTLDELFGLLESGFHEKEGLPTGWDSDCVPLFRDWVDSLSCQILDLAEMSKSGVLQDPQRYFGLPGPRGVYWYNFDPFTFLECGVAGFFGGWKPGDDSGRISTSDHAADPEGEEDQEFEILGINWEGVKEFFFTCQVYE